MSIRIKLVLGTAALVFGAVRCASYKPIAVTTNPAAVSSCQRVADVALRNDRSYDDPVKSLIEEARAKGANTLLYEPQPDGAMKHGVAYECSLPPAAEKPQP
jgi:hypothetical protein